jgi:hypothetical protein
VVWLRLSNAFFDRSLNHRDMVLTGGESEEFLRRFVIPNNREYFFVRFTPPPPPWFITGIRSC